MFIFPLRRSVSSCYLMSMDRTPLAVRLREARKARGHTQAVLAHKLGVCSQTVSRWERGDTEPQGLRLLLDLAGILGVSVEYLMGLADE